MVEGVLSNVHRMVEEIGDVMFAEFLESRFVIGGWPTPPPIPTKRNVVLNFMDRCFGHNGNK